MKLRSNNHSVFSLNYHLILVVKYRRKIINAEISKRLKGMFEEISVKYNIHLKEWKFEADHIHILFEAEPNSELSKFINAYKSASSRIIKKEFPEIRPKLWKEYFWSRSFCLLSAGGAPLAAIREYINSQGEDRIDGRTKEAKRRNQVPDLSDTESVRSSFENLRMLPQGMEPDAR